MRAIKLGTSDPIDGEAPFSFPHDWCINPKGVHSLTIFSANMASKKYKLSLFDEIEFCREPLSQHNPLFVCEGCKSALFRLNNRYLSGPLKRPRNHDIREHIIRKRRALEFLRIFYVEHLAGNLKKMEKRLKGGRKRTVTNLVLTL